MRDYRKLEAFRLADTATKRLLMVAKTWPSEHRFGLTAQMIRAAISIGSNIAEGSTRGEKEYVHFLRMAHGSCHELAYQLTLAEHLEFAEAVTLREPTEQACRALGGLIRSLSPGPRTQDPGPS